MSDEALYASLRVVFVDGKPYIPENNTTYVANSAYDFGEEEVNAEEEDELYDETKFYGITGLATVLKVSRTIVQSLPLDTVPYMYKVIDNEYVKCYYIAEVHRLLDCKSDEGNDATTTNATDKKILTKVPEGYATVKYLRTKYGISDKFLYADEFKRKLKGLDTVTVEISCHQRICYRIEDLIKSFFAVFPEQAAGKIMLK